MNADHTAQDSVPLIVDMDDTLLATDSLWEGLFTHLHRKPAVIFKILPLLGQKTELKKLLLDDAESIKNYPLRADIVNYLENEKSAGREIYLATASLAPVAAIIAERVGLFSDVFASDQAVNLKGQTKANFLESRFGKGGFDYIGDSESDLPVWQAARKALIYGPDSLLQKALHVNANAARVAPAPHGALGAVCRELRVRQWVKNLLVFIPMFLDHDFTFHAFLMSLLAFFSICFCASSIYVINDVLDLPNDRIHPVKRHRPFASGALGLKSAPVLAGGAVTFSVALAILLPPAFLLYVLLYFAITVMYSFSLKKRLLLDVIALAFLYVLRIKMGGVATGIEISNWVYGFMSFFFLGLALMKRSSDFAFQKDAGRAYGRAYRPGDVPILEMMQVACCFATIVVLCLYIESDVSAMHYAHPGWLWFACPALLWWYCKLILLASRGEMMGDPILFAVREKASYAALGVIGLCFVLAM